MWSPLSDQEIVLESPLSYRFLKISSLSFLFLFIGGLTNVHKVDLLISQKIGSDWPGNVSEPQIKIIFPCPSCLLFTFFFLKKIFSCPTSGVYLLFVSTSLYPLIHCLLNTDSVPGMVMFICEQNKGPCSCGPFSAVLSNRNIT